ncbi:hypothetical protein FN846DRAFT_886986 [Sphaerosporella brunnea]|uniref:Uncharacterized protein n=1 Tax=Sphaerosporella brunnea TaxID=1250544 RepID=A0A5J5F7J1_9PEZI|nr:hypothetical protein FN846DRAFT_886986 [Sphaerosporella brunnea]
MAWKEGTLKETAHSSIADNCIALSSAPPTGVDPPQKTKHRPNSPARYRCNTRRPCTTSIDSLQRNQAQSAASKISTSKPNHLTGTRELHPELAAGTAQDYLRYASTKEYQPSPLIIQHAIDVATLIRVCLKHTNIKLLVFMHNVHQPQGAHIKYEKGLSTACCITGKQQASPKAKKAPAARGKAVITSPPSTGTSDPNMNPITRKYRLGECGGGG